MLISITSLVSMCKIQKNLVYLIFIMSEIKLCFVTNASFIAVKTKTQIGQKWPNMHTLGLKIYKNYPPSPPSGRVAHLPQIGTVFYYMVPVIHN